MEHAAKPQNKEPKSHLYNGREQFCFIAASEPRHFPQIESNKWPNWDEVNQNSAQKEDISLAGYRLAPLLMFHYI